MRVQLLGYTLQFITLCASVSVVQANPIGGSVAQGSATISSSGSVLTIQQNSSRAAINWQSFNIGLGETTTFIQPSSSSVIWNRINDMNPSQILGNLNANGYVILQNQSGFYIGGQAVLTVHGLLMTTAPIPVPDLSSSGPWQFNALPPTASIVNFGRITTPDTGGSVFLIAHDIQNNGSVSAPQGNIGLYAGREVLVSDRPDGRGLSARVTLPEGSVNNSGSLVADAGRIEMQAQVVNQGGLVQANSVRDANGVIELVAGDSLNLSDTSVISATGDATSASGSQGGFVTLKSGNTLVDTPASSIRVAGANGGQGGILELLWPGATIAALQSSLDSPFAVLANPSDITISSDPTDVSSSSPNFYKTDLTRYSQINLEALDNIQITTPFTLADRTGFGTLSLQAGNNITLGDPSGTPSASITVGRNWSLNLTAGTQLTAAADRQAGSDGIYLYGSSFVQGQNGDISLWAGNEVQINSGDSGSVGNNGIRTLAGGSIFATTLFGDINTGANPQGFRTPYRSSAPFYSVLRTCGGISTVAGGDVNLDAGGDVISYLPTGNDPSVASDGGSGAFGPQAGNVTVTAGGSVYGHFIVANGVGSITAVHNVGDADNNVALSLISGSWSLNAPHGNIYLQEVRNPNGVFNNGANNPSSAGYHNFDYAPEASVSLTAGMGVYLTGLDLPRSTDPAPPMIFPPILQITSGSDIVLGDSISLFPSRHQSLHIEDGGSFLGVPNNPELTPTPFLVMSDHSASQTHWTDPDSFGLRDHTASSTELANMDPDPATIHVAGIMENLILMTSKQTHLSVDGDMRNCSFSGQNLHADDVTSITVGGQIFNSGPYSFYTLNQAIPLLGAPFLALNTRATWDSIFSLALDPTKLATLQVPPNQSIAQLQALLSNAALFQSRPGFFYDATSHRLGFIGSMSDGIKAALEHPLVLVVYNANGFPAVDANGHFVTRTVSWGVAAAAIDSLFTDSQNASSTSSPASLGYEVGGPGLFSVHAGSISLGSTYGILTTGVGDAQGNRRFANLAPFTPIGANLCVTVQSDTQQGASLEMSASTIAALGGGDVKVVSTGGAMDLGSEQLANLERDIIHAHGFGLGIYASGVAITDGSLLGQQSRLCWTEENWTEQNDRYCWPANWIDLSKPVAQVIVAAMGDISIQSSRVASYDGGSIYVQSCHGNVNAGNGDAILTPIVSYYVDSSGAPAQFRESVFGSGILATTLIEPARVPGSPFLPGNIDVGTPEGDIVANQGGIRQSVLNGTLLPGPTITLNAGTPSGHAGNIELGDSGVIGGTVNLYANGNISGLVISRQNSTINAAQSFSGTVLSGGTANLSAGGTVTGTIIGIGGANVSGGAGISAAVLGQNVSVQGGQAQSTLGTTATATVASQAAAGQATSDAHQQVTREENPKDDDKRKLKRPTLTRRSRVTVILPK